MKIKYPKNFVFFAGCAELHLEDAKIFCERMKLSSDDVKIVITHTKDVLVKAKTEIELEEE